MPTQPSQAGPYGGVFSMTWWQRGAPLSIRDAAIESCDDGSQPTHGVNLMSDGLVGSEWKHHQSVVI
jgi:hypothetical protein